MTIDGSVELANAGNSYSGITHIASGTLAITGDANAMQSAVVVEAGAKLIMDASNAAAMTSSFTISLDGELQIGTSQSSGNVFPDNPPIIVNHGAIRVLDEESLTAISGDGAIAIEQETATLSANPDFNGEIVVKPGAAVKVLDSGGLGSVLARTTVEQGAALVMDSSSMANGAIEVAGEGAGAGAIRMAAGHNATFNSEVVLRSETVSFQADTGATGTFAGHVSGDADETTLILGSDVGANLRLQGGLSLGAGGVTKRGVGTAEFGGPLSYTGDTAIEGGTLRLTGSGLLSGAFLLDSGAALELAGTHSFSSGARVSGSGQVIGDLLMPGTIAPGSSAGTLTLANSLSLVDSSVLEIELGGLQASIDFDLLQVVGQATLDGALEVTLLNDFIPSLGDSFEVLTAFGGVGGAFDSTILPTLGDGLAWNVLYNSNSLLLKVESSAIALPGDYNGDAVVDAADYTVWRNTLGSMTDLTADGDQSNMIDQGDYDVWAARFGLAASASTTAVAEPNSVALLLLGFALCLPRRARWLRV